MTSLAPMTTTTTTTTTTTMTTMTTTAPPACANVPRAAQARGWVPFASALARVQRERVTPAQTRPLHRV
jgi:hypothetical protein